MDDADKTVRYLLVCQHLTLSLQLHFETNVVVMNFFPREIM